MIRKGCAGLKSVVLVVVVHSWSEPSHVCDNLHIYATPFTSMQRHKVKLAMTVNKGSATPDQAFIEVGVEELDTSNCESVVRGSLFSMSLHVT